MPQPSRRDFLRAIAVVVGPSLVAGCGDGDATDSEPPARDYFPQSVASGDPRPESVVIWTRVVDPEDDGALELGLELSLDESFAERVSLAGAGELSLSASPEHDHCVKVRLDGLEPGTVYFYRFVYRRGGERHLSRIGRVKTAPALDSDATVRFAVLSCQDYGGKYFHVHRHLSEQDLDFFVHLGDYVYETVGDPSFQSPTPDREVRFGRPEEALSLGGGSGLAARSLDNYRDLYRIVRGDRDLQRAHESTAMIAVWDDHEFSNDCHGANGTYSDGREVELDLERRRNADRAWFEYMPVDDVESPALPLDESAEFPDDFRIYRSFAFGRHLELVMTDLRRYRPDHVVPEEALPGAVFLDEPNAVALLGAVPDDAVPYVDVGELAGGAYQEALRAVAPELDFDPERVQGLISVSWINQMLDAAGVSEPSALDESDASLSRGYAYHQLLKTEPYTSLGARLFVAERPFSALALRKHVESNGASERLMGGEQRQWFTETLLASTRTWKVWGNEFTLMPRVLDLVDLELLPEAFRARVLLTADDWDGAPNERDALLRELGPVENLVVVTGDFHAFFAGTPYPSGDPSARVIELVLGSASSTPALVSVGRALESFPDAPPDAAVLVQSVGALLQDREKRPNPHLSWHNLTHNGYAVLSVGADWLEARVLAMHPELVATPPAELSGSHDGRFEVREFRVATGSRELELNQGGTWRRWDLELAAWV